MKVESGRRITEEGDQAQEIEVGEGNEIVEGNARRRDRVMEAPREGGKMFGEVAIEGSEQRYG